MIQPDRLADQWPDLLADLERRGLGLLVQALQRARPIRVFGKLVIVLAADEPNRRGIALQVVRNGPILCRLATGRFGTEIRGLAPILDLKDDQDSRWA